MYKFESSDTEVFIILSLSLILMATTMLQSGYSQGQDTFSVSSVIIGNDKPISATIDEKTNKVYGIFATERGAKNLLYVIDIAQNKVLDTIEIGTEKNDFLSNIVLDADRGILYATGQHLVNENDTTIAYDTVYVINSTNNKFKRIQLYGESEEGKEGSLAGISVNPVTNKIYVGSLYPEGGKPGLYQIDGNTLEPLYLEKWRYGIKDIQLNSESNLLYVGAKYDNLVSIIDESNNQIVENITVQSPIALTLNAKERILYEAGSDGKVNAIDLTSKKDMSSIQGKNVKNILYNTKDELLYIVDQNTTNILSKNSNGTKNMVIGINTSNNTINKFETNFIIENILINSSTDQIYLLGYDGENSKLFIVNSH